MTVRHQATASRKLHPASSIPHRFFELRGRETRSRDRQVCTLPGKSVMTKRLHFTRLDAARSDDPGNGRGRTDLETQEPEEPDVAVPAQPVFVLNDAQFDSWAFGGKWPDTTIRSKLDSLLTMQIDEIDRNSTLTEAQRNKLRLAGSGDIKRFVDRVEEKRSQLIGRKVDQNKINELYQQIQPLQATFSRRPLRGGIDLFQVDQQDADGGAECSPRGPFRRGTPFTTGPRLSWPSRD